MTKKYPSGVKRVLADGNQLFYRIQLHPEEITLEQRKSSEDEIRATCSKSLKKYVDCRHTNKKNLWRESTCSKEYNNLMSCLND
jgi:hypothetical protein